MASDLSNFLGKENKFSMELIFSELLFNRLKFNLSSQYDKGRLYDSIKEYSIYGNNFY